MSKYTSDNNDNSNGALLSPETLVGRFFDHINDTLAN